MPQFNGTLKHNEIFNAIYNMIISQQVFADNIADTKSTLADMSRVDGSLYGDTKLYYSTDVLKSIEWTNDAEAQNLLKLHRPEAPEVQAITIDQFRMIPLTVDNYLSKRAFSTEGTFSQFASQMLAWMRDTKKVYDATLFNSFVGTHEAGLENDGKGAKQQRTVTLPAEPTGDEINVEAYNRLVASAIAEDAADLLVELEDVSRDFNDYGNLRSYNAGDLVYVWNSEWVNKIKKLGEPTIFNKEGLIDKFAQHVLPARYFGNINTTSGTTGGTNITIRSRIEKDYNTVEPDKPGYDASKHIFPGDLLPANTAYEANETYSQDSSIVYKVYHKNSIPFMTAFETGTEFFNPRSLTQTHYLIWGYNALESLKNYPFITVKATNAE
ncbi:MAG: hypothetical protein J6A25_09365 [Lachnospiraceae bacterium]|nr:hypothetical protein [Lachnospiraceae bacterium]